MEWLAVKLTAAAHSFSGIGRGFFLVLRQILNCSLTLLSQGRGVWVIFRLHWLSSFGLLDNRS